jgi:Ca2+-binding RTX toxin-like protein
MSFRTSRSFSSMFKSFNNSTTRNHPAVARAAAAACEPLEGRRMLASVVGGQLRVTGTDYADIINVSQVSVSGVTKIRVSEERVGGAIIRIGLFTASTITNGIYVDANNGNDAVTISTSVTKPTTVIGSYGNDTILGGNGNDLLKGGSGNDKLDGRGGNDVVEGGSGTDLVDYSNRTTALNVSLDNVANDTGAGGTDNIKSDVENVYGGSASDRITGSAANNYLKGNAGNDTLYGLGGNDRLRGDSGNDQLHGGDGNDILNGGSGADYLNGQAGYDTADYADRTANLYLNPDGYSGDGADGENDNISTSCETVIGGSGNDYFVGHDGRNDVFFGNAGNDTMYGEGGDDFLDGGSGDDVLAGGLGNDTLVAGTGSDWLYADLDFGYIDKLYVSPSGDGWYADASDIVDTYV